MFFHYALSPEAGYNSLYYTVELCCLSILNVIACIYQPQIPSPSLSLPHHLGNRTSDLYICGSVSVL